MGWRAAELDTCKRYTNYKISIKIMILNTDTKAKEIFQNQNLRNVDLIQSRYLTELFCQLLLEFLVKYVDFRQNIDYHYSYYSYSSKFLDHFVENT